MTHDRADRRRRRRESQLLFDELAAAYPSRPGVTRRLMFGSEGLRYEGSFFAFVGGDGELIVKLPKEQADRLVGSGEATRMRAGRREMRQWIGVPAPNDAAHAGRWRTLTDDAYRYALSLRSP